MTTIVSELHDALKAAGVQDDIARAAARTVVAIEDKEQLVTKADLASALSDLKSDLVKTTVTMMFAMTGFFAAISAALKLVK
jgi:hypothetical protein